jgi:hypothetical protein
MSRKVLAPVATRQRGKWAGIGAVCLSVLFAGCGPQADLALKFSAGDRAKYIVTDEDIKDFKFEQPSLNKVRSEPRSTTTQIKFTQEIESVDENGGVAIITIIGLKYFAEGKGEVKFDFDSSREADKKTPLAKLPGRSYKIKLASDGSVQVLDANKIRSAVTGGQAGRVAKSLLSDESIQKRHENLFLPDADNSLLRQGDSWSRTEAAQQRLMVPKSFEKTYTLTKVTGQDGHQIAVVNMNATETATAPGTVSKIVGGIGLFANMFDTEEDYTGEMVLNLDTGKVAKYYEKFVTKYIAAEPSAKQKTDKGPDILTIVLTYSTTMEMLD